MNFLYTSGGPGDAVLLRTGIFCSNCLQEDAHNVSVAGELTVLAGVCLSTLV